jgi:hypothetical protein
MEPGWRSIHIHPLIKLVENIIYLWYARSRMEGIFIVRFIADIILIIKSRYSYLRVNHQVQWLCFLFFYQIRVVAVIGR